MMGDNAPLIHMAEIPPMRKSGRSPGVKERHIQAAIHHKRNNMDAASQEQWFPDAVNTITTKPELNNAKSHHAEYADGTQTQLRAYMETNRPKRAGETNIQETTRQEYADDSIIIIELNKVAHILTQLQNYQTVTHSRQLCLQWKKGRATNNQKTRAPHRTTTCTFQHDRIQWSRKNHWETNPHGKQTENSHERPTQESQNIMGAIRNKIFLDEGVKPEIRIQLWNALIRPTLTYALHTKPTNHQIANRQIEGFSYR